MSRRIVYINAEHPYEDHTEVVRAKVTAGEWKVVNAPRPIPGDLCFVGEFRHGTFYAAGEPARYEAEWVDLEAWYVEEIDNAEIERRLAARAAAEGFTLNEALAINSIERHASGMGLPWRSES